MTGISERAQIFGFPIGSYQIDPAAPELAALADEIEAEEKRSKGVMLSNRGGWQSEKAFFEAETGAFPPIRDRIFDAFEAFLEGVYGQPLSRQTFALETWANVNYRGHYNASHDHTANDNHWSGILYLRTGHADGEPQTGITVFENRILTGDGRYISNVPVLREAPAATPTQLAVAPKVGGLLFFPGTLRHHVTRYEGTGKRITVAFNVRAKALANHQLEEGSLPDRVLSYLRINFRGLFVAGARARRFLS